MNAIVLVDHEKVSSLFEILDKLNKLVVPRLQETWSETERNNLHLYWKVEMGWKSELDSTCHVEVKVLICKSVYYPVTAVRNDNTTSILQTVRDWNFKIEHYDPKSPPAKQSRGYWNLCYINDSRHHIQASKKQIAKLILANLTSQ